MDYLEQYRQWGAMSHDPSKKKRNRRMLKARERGLTYTAIAKKFNLSLGRTRQIIDIQRKIKKSSGEW